MIPAITFNGKRTYTDIFLSEHAWQILTMSFQGLSHDVGLTSVHREILSPVTIVFYDKVRVQNKAQR